MEGSEGVEWGLVVESWLTGGVDPVGDVVEGGLVGGDVLVAGEEAAEPSTEVLNAGFLVGLAGVAEVDTVGEYVVVQDAVVGEFSTPVPGEGTDQGGGVTDHLVADLVGDVVAVLTFGEGDEFDEAGMGFDEHGTR